ncbi:MAG: hypothetical protein OHK0057_24430 [Thermoflexibacter sp.]
MVSVISINKYPTPKEIYFMAVYYYKKLIFEQAKTTFILYAREGFKEEQLVLSQSIKTFSYNK